MTTEKLPPLPEPAAWLHRQGNHSEASERRLDADEEARGWTQVGLHADDQMLAYGAECARMAREEAAKLCDDEAWSDNDPRGFLTTIAAAIRKG